MLKNEEVILRSIGVQDVIDFYDKRKRPLFGTSVKGVISNEYYECANSHHLTLIDEGSPDGSR